MKVTKNARSVSSAARDQMSADAIALMYDAGVNLSTSAVLGAIAATLDSCGDPLDRIWLEDSNARRRTYSVEDTLPVLKSASRGLCRLTRRLRYPLS